MEETHHIMFQKLPASTPGLLLWTLTYSIRPLLATLAVSLLQLPPINHFYPRSKSVLILADIHCYFKYLVDAHLR